VGSIERRLKALEDRVPSPGSASSSDSNALIRSVLKRFQFYKWRGSPGTEGPSPLRTPGP
jgi:hypothetical protein